MFPVVQKKQNRQKAKSPGASTEASCRPRIPSPLTNSMDMRGFSVKLSILVWGMAYSVVKYQIAFNKLIIIMFLERIGDSSYMVTDSACLTVLDNCHSKAIMDSNNTPPASRQISAPRGVTRFWGTEK